MKIGYARVSTQHQELEIQIEALRNFGCERIYSETISGKDNSRPQLNAMIENLRAGDVVVVYRIDRISRSLLSLISLVEIFKEKKVDIISLDTSDKIDTTTPMGMALLQVTGVLAEVDRKQIIARTAEGRKKAKEAGVKFGRKCGYRLPSTEEKIETIKIYIRANQSYNWIANKLKVSKVTISKVKKSMFG